MQHPYHPPTTKTEFDSHESTTVTTGAVLLSIRHYVYSRSLTTIRNARVKSRTISVVHGFFLQWCTLRTSLQSVSHCQRVVSAHLQQRRDAHTSANTHPKQCLRCAMNIMQLRASIYICKHHPHSKQTRFYCVCVGACVVVLAFVEDEGTRA